jgi:hypothetical protein
MLAVGTPRRAVVHQHLGGQAVAAEGGGQPAPFFRAASRCEGTETESGSSFVAPCVPRPRRQS